MSTYSLGPAPTFDAKKWRSLGWVLALHLVAFYFIYSGTLRRVITVAAPQEIFLEFAAPRETPKPQKTLALEAPAPVSPPSVFVPPVEAVLNAPTPPVLSTTSEPKSVVAPAAAPAAAAPAAPVQNGPRLITSGVEYLQAPQPVYPNVSKRIGEQGRVVLKVLVNEKGLAESAQVQTSSGSARLDEAGRQAALGARYKPYMENGHAVPVFVLVPLNFQLQS